MGYLSREGGGRRVITFDCSACHATIVGVFEDGCPNCGAGTAAANDAALQEAIARAAERPKNPDGSYADLDQERTGEPVRRIDVTLSDDAIAEAVINGLTAGNSNDVLLKLEGYSDKAIKTIATALAFYAANVVPEPDELPLDVIEAWSTRLLQGE